LVLNALRGGRVELITRADRLAGRPGALQRTLRDGRAGVPLGRWSSRTPPPIARTSQHRTCL